MTDDLLDPIEKALAVAGIPIPVPTNGSDLRVHMSPASHQRFEQLFAWECPLWLAALVGRLRQAEQERDTLRAALVALVAKIDECKPHIDAAFLFQWNHGGTYDGPNFHDELEAARKLGASAPPEPR